MDTNYVKKYISPIDYIIEQYRSDGIVRKVDENNPLYLEWLKDDKNVLSIIPFITPPPKTILLEDVKIEKKKELKIWFDNELNKPLQVNDDPPIFIKQTESDLNLWEKGIKGFLLSALELGYFDGPNTLTDEELLDLSVGTVRGSVIMKAKNYTVSPIDYYGKPLFINIGTMVQFTLKLASAFQENFMRYHLLTNFVDFATNFEMLTYLTSWDVDLGVYGYPPM